jgi:cytochrome c553
MRLLLLLASAAALGWAADFVNEIHPILASRCLSCHSGGKPQANLDLTKRETAARILNDTLLNRVEGKAGRIMPPVGAPLKAEEIAKLREWIAEGAPWADVASKAPNGWEAPLAPRQVPLPAGTGHPIDRFTGVSSKGLATDDAFAHRAYLDLWGMPPSEAQLLAFRADTRSDKRARLIDSLLAEERNYTHHWMSWWNDMLRNDIGVIYHGERKSITNWLETALRENMPYDGMVRELLNPIGNGSPEGFLVGVNWRGDVNASQTPWMQASQNTAQVFLGINLKCASCHDSFINKYKLKEAYGLAAMFSKEASLELVRCDNKTGVQQPAEFLWPELGKIPAGASPSERRYWAAKLFTHPGNGRLSRTLVNRYWQKLMGTGLVEPVDDMDAKPSNPDLLDWLAYDFAQKGHDLKYLLKLLMTSSEYQRADAKPRRISAEQLTDTLSAVTGEWRTLTSGSSDRAFLARDWQLKSSPLTRAMGRPIRDQVYTTRGEEATTFQLLELSNGPTLAAMLHRGSRRLLGELPEAPENLYDSKFMRQGTLNVEASLSSAKQVFLLTEDAGTFDPERVVVGWRDIRLSGPAGEKVLEAGSVATKLGTRLVFDVPNGYNKLTATVWVSDASKASDIDAQVRFFVFGAEPDRQRLVRLGPGSPAPAPQALRSADEAITRFWRQILSRDPKPEERAEAAKLFAAGKLSREGVEDLLWSLLMHPEFQYIW